MRIFLIGMPGSGKSTYGRKLFERFGYNFFDLDEEIERRENNKITDIFESKGENYFRQLETSVLRDVVESNRHFIMATGGGTPCFFDNMAFMKSKGKVIYLNTSVDELSERLKNDQERPLLKKERPLSETLEALKSKREKVFNQADFIVRNYNELESVVVKFNYGVGF